MVDKEVIDLNVIRKVLEISDVQLFPLYLKEVYKDLVDRAESNKKAGISKVTFYGYSKLPVLIADKLFNALDKDNDGYLGIKEFIEGMNMLYYGSFKQSAKIIFNMYDFDRDGFINKEDIKCLFSYLPLKNEEKQIESLVEIDQILSFYKIDNNFNFNKFIDTIEKNKSDIYLQMLCFLIEHRPFAVENVETCKLLTKYKELQNNQQTELDQLGSPIPHRMKSSILSETINLASPSKTTIFKPVENIMNMMEIQDFNLDEDSPEDIKVELPKNPINKQPHSHNFSPSDLKSNEVIRMPNNREFKESNKFETPSTFLKKDEKVDAFDLNGSPEKKTGNFRKQSSIIVKTPDVISKGGLIYKITENGNLKSYYLLLCNKDIYYYKNDKCKELLGMHNLSGCYIDDSKGETKKLDDDNELFSFSILFSNKTRTYFTTSQKETEEWIVILKQAIGYQSFTDRYEMQSKTLGEGKFGLVKLGVHKSSGEKVAIKIIKKEFMTPKDKELVKSEIDIMKMCKHKNIVRLLDHYENNEFIFIVMEYLAGGTFANYLESTPVDDLSEKQASFCIYQITKALEYLHQFGIIHRDLKPENIMIKSKLPYESLDSLKVMDFGLSKVLGPNEKVNDGYGTLTYVAPEVLTRKPYNKHVDVWSLGVILFYTLSGTFPFDDSSNDEEVIAKKTVFSELKFQHKSWPGRSPSAKDFILKAMTKDLEKRAKIGDLINHQWFVDCEVIQGKKGKKNSMIFDK